MASKIESLKAIPLFSSLSDSDLEEIISIAVRKSFGKNEVIFHQDEPGSILFILTSGMVKVSLISPMGKEIILKLLYPNDFFGEMSLLDGKFRCATATAVEESKTLAIPQENFIRLLEEKPHFSLAMVGALNRRLREATQQIGHLSFFDAYGKVAHVLLDLISKQGDTKGNGISLKLACSKLELAEMAGLTRETFARVLNQFQERGYLTVEGKKIVITDRRFLNREIH